MLIRYPRFRFRKALHCTLHSTALHIGYTMGESLACKPDPPLLLPLLLLLQLSHRKALLASTQGPRFTYMIKENHTFSMTNTVEKEVSLTSKILCDECINGKPVRYDCCWSQTKKCKCPRGGRWSCSCVPDTGGRFDCECCRICKCIVTKRLNSARVLKLYRKPKKTRTRTLHTQNYKPDTCSKCLQSVIHKYRGEDSGERSIGNEKFRGIFPYRKWILTNVSIETIHNWVKKYYTREARTKVSDIISRKREEKVLQLGRTLTQIEKEQLWIEYITSSM
jgi:hypothetical protein